jgi:hypothetical protein
MPSTIRNPRGGAPCRLLGEIVCASFATAFACTPPPLGPPTGESPPPPPPLTASAEPPPPSAGVVASAPEDAGPPSEDDAGPIRAVSLAGPFAKLSDHCARTRALGSAYPCDLAPGAFGRALRGGKGPMLEARLFMIHFDMAGRPASLCFIGIRTKLGWFAEDPETGDPCQGAFAPGGTATTTTNVLRFTDDGGALLVETTSRGVRNNKKSAGSTMHIGRGATVCAVGPSGVPSCADVPVGCNRGDGDPSLPVPRWHFRAGADAGPGGGVVEIEAVDHGESVICEPAGTRSLVFP